jgi:hypothetical protein
MSLLVASAVAAPGGIHRQAFELGYGAGAPVYAAAPQVVHQTYAAAPQVVHQTYAVQPAVAQVSVPITKHVHYETKPVVTGYSSTIIKPAIPSLPIPQLPAVHVAHPAPVVVGKQLEVPGIVPDVPEFPEFPFLPPPGTNSSNDSPTQKPPQFPFPLPEFPGQGVNVPSLPPFPVPQTTFSLITQINTVLSSLEQKPVVAVAPATNDAVIVQGSKKVLLFFFSFLGISPFIN